jgi:release factor glutamine methyltransferase
MHSPTKRVWFQDLKFDVTEDVFEPSEDSFMFAENLDVNVEDEVLDLGTGSGILGVLAAKKAKNVLAVDINPHAIRCAKQNAVLNNVRAKMQFMQSDLLFALTGEVLFDVILFNAPYLPSEPFELDSWIGRAWAGGATGRDVVDKFIPQATIHLKPSGRILLLQSTLTGLESTIQMFQEYGFKATVKAESKLPFFETIQLIEATAAQ